MRSPKPYPFSCNFFWIIVSISFDVNVSQTGKKLLSDGGIDTGGGGHLPNFCMRVCQRGVQNHTLSLATFLKKTPFLLQFFWWKICCFPCKFCQNVPFYKQNHREMTHSSDNFWELSSSNTLSAQKTHPFSCILMKKKHPFYCVFDDKCTLDVGTTAVPYI